MSQDIDNGWHNRVICHNALEPFPLPNQCIDVVMTSPPYWGLRDYGVDGQIGLESHPSEYIDHLVCVAREIKRVLKKSGSFYLNLGDTYFGSGTGQKPDHKGKMTEGQFLSAVGANEVRNNCKSDRRWLQPKQLMLIPVRVACALQDDGWILRNDIIWHKPNPMPSSVKDRLNNTFEHVFHFVKSKRYYYNLDSIREPHKTVSIKRVSQNLGNPVLNTDRKRGHPVGADTLNPKQFLHKNGKNPGDIIASDWNWRSGMNRDESEIIEVRIGLPSQKEFVDYLKPLTKDNEDLFDELFGETRWRHWIRYDQSGFSFPSIHDWKVLKEKLDLDDTFDLSKTEFKYNNVQSNPKGKAPGDFWDICTQPFTSFREDMEHFAVFPEELVEKPLKASCPDDGVVLDPFGGRGTVGRVAKRLGLKWVVFDLNTKYCELSELFINGQKRKLIDGQSKLT